MKQIGSTKPQRRPTAKRPWKANVLELTEVERGGSWQPKFSSFSTYVEDKARRLGTKGPALWRDISGYRSYERLRLQHIDLRLPEFCDLPDPVTVEHLTMLGALSRAAPPELIRELLPQVSAGAVSRAYLKELKHVYLDKTKTKIPQGRPPRDAERGMATHPAPDPAISAAARAIVVAGQTAAEWLGIPNKKSELRVFSRPRSNVDFDLIIAAREPQSRSVQIHGIEARWADGLRYALPPWLEFYRHYVDLFWFLLVDATPETVPQPPLLPEAVGFLLLIDDKIVVHRRAQPATDRANNESGSLAKHLLLLE